MKINIKNTAFVMVMAGALAWNIGYAYNRFYTERDYLISQHISCDPEEENCFVWQCDPAIEECSEDAEENIDYYKHIEKSAARIPECLTPEECEELSCEPAEENCTITPCTPADAVEEGVQCSSDLEVPEEAETEESDVEETEDAIQGP